MHTEVTDNTPVLSVVIPCYNAESTIGSVIQAVLEAEPLPVEVVVVDDGSSDDSRRIAESFPVRVIANDGNHGPSHTRNRGAMASKGDIICFVDSDVLVPKNLFADLTEHMESRPDLCAANPVIEPDSSHEDFFSDFLDLRLHYGFTSIRRRVTSLCTSCVAIRRRCFIDVGGFLESAKWAVNDEVMLGWRLGQKGHEVLVLPDIRVKHLKNMTLGSWVRKYFLEGYQWISMASIHLRQTGFGEVTRMTLNYTRPASAIIAALLTITVLGYLLFSTPVFFPLALLLALHVSVNARQILFFATHRSLAYVPFAAVMVLLESLLHVAGMGCGLLRGIWTRVAPS